MPDSTPLTVVDARHLLRRTGFGAPSAEVAALVGRTRGAVVTELLAFTPQSFKPGGRLPSALHDKWIKFMVKAKTPLQEKLVLFWHDHFATGVSKVIVDQADGRAEQALSPPVQGRFPDADEGRQHGPGDDGVPRHGPEREDDPQRELRARAAWSSSRSASPTRAAHPNYTQADIVQIARAFTGWSRHGKAACLRRRPPRFQRGLRGAAREPRAEGHLQVDGRLRRGRRPLCRHGRRSRAPTEIDTIIDIMLRRTPTPTARTLSRAALRAAADRVLRASRADARSFVDEVVAPRASTRPGTWPPSSTRSSSTTPST